LKGGGSSEVDPGLPGKGIATGGKKIKGPPGGNQFYIRG